MHLYWLSFVAPGRGSLGVVVTEAASARDAHEKVTRLGQNPGGEAMIIEVPDEPAAVEEVGKYPRDVLLTPEVLRAGGAIRAKDAGPYDPEKGPPVVVEYVCGDCNEDQVPRA